MDKVIPRCINYADIKPEAIENQVKVVRFTPTATVNSARPNDIVRFQLQGQGFYDPYSAYIRMEITYTETDFPDPTVGNVGGRLLDRSAHSIINRLVIRSQGTELERIEQFDIMAAMINDMLYSQEQKQLHHVEGFPTEQICSLGPWDIGQCQSSLAFRVLTSGNQPTIYNSIGDQGYLKMNAIQLANPASILPDVAYVVNANDGHGIEAVGGRVGILSTPLIQTFCIPIYSGVIGVLMPDKKMIPLSLIPLEVEFTINPYAMYEVGTANINPRQYSVSKFWIYSHVLFFEQELHRSLEAVTAESGIFIHFNSFYLAPVTNHVGRGIQNYAQINVHAKSINSVHFVFIYNGYEQPAGPRKLHFVNHNLRYLQIRNGTDLIPSEPLEGNQVVKAGNNHSQFLIETLKAWNKLHDPTTDACITSFNYQFDRVPLTANFLNNTAALIQSQAQLGRCQYAISMEGEELGMDKTIITGRKGMIPFDINMGVGEKTEATDSLQFIFVKADYILYCRPDLVIQVLGR